MIYHFQNNCYKYFVEFYQYLISQPIELTKDIQIITCSNHEDSSILIDQLKLNKISYINKVSQGVEWDNRDKIKYILEALHEVTSKYVLILDANDVLIENVRNLITDFQSMGCKLLYNATCNNYPKVDIDEVLGRENMGKFRYLNAGCCIGETKYTEYFYKKALEYIDIENPWRSEQYIIRHAFRECMNDVKFDYECRIFQTVGGCSLIKLGNIWKVI